MESIPLDMDDIFDGEEDVEDFSPSRLPDLEDELEPMRDSRRDDNDDDDQAENNQPDADNEELLAKLKNMKGASKHVAKRTMPKLDATRLTGERGIPILPQFFKDIPLKGAKHEKEDLKLIMQKLEHWAHRLFPKMPFPEVLERVERLGAKKDVQSCVKRIRLDMPMSVNDNVQNDDEEDVPDTEQDAGSPHIHRTNIERTWSDDEAEEALMTQASITREPGDRTLPLPLSDERMLPLPPSVERTLLPTDERTLLPSDERTLPASAVDQQAHQTKIVSEELKSRIEQNRKLALERRAAKLAQVAATTAVAGDDFEIRSDR